MFISFLLPDSLVFALCFSLKSVNLFFSAFFHVLFVYACRPQHSLTNKIVFDSAGVQNSYN